MLALYRCGRQADALRAFTDIADRLDRQLGVVPSPELRQLEEDILLQRANLAGDGARSQKAVGAHRRPPSTRVIGRRTELGQLLEAYGLAVAGERCVVLVQGTAGIGKTTLVDEFCSRAAHFGADVLVGRCTQDQADGYQAIAEIVRAVVDRLDEEQRAALPAGVGIVAPEAVDGRGVLPALDGDPESSRLRTHQEIAALFDRHTTRPCVIVVEDAHWANRATLTLLRSLLRRQETEGLLAVVTLRDDEIGAERAERIEALLPPAQVRSLQLAPFDDNEVRAVVRVTAAPESMPKLVELAPAIRAVTGGNPLFVRELLRDLDDGATKLDDGIERSLASSAPAGVLAIIDRRVERLTPCARSVLGAMSLLRDGVPTRVLAAVCELTPQELLDGLEECLAARLLVEDTEQIDRFSFPHTFVRSAIRRTVDADARPALHARIATVLEAVPTTTSAELAYHCCEAATLGTHARRGARRRAGGRRCPPRLRLRPGGGMVRAGRRTSRAGRPRPRHHSAASTSPSRGPWRRTVGSIAAAT